MEYINRIELQGKVGSVRSQVIGTAGVQNFSLMTEQMFRHSDGSVIVEAAWHNIVAWGFKVVQKGDSVRVVGRIRQTKYTSASGEEKVLHEILASELSVIED